jgi:septal ring-binding cell division protein DamX
VVEPKAPEVKAPEVKAPEAKPERPADARAQADREWVLQLKPGQWVLQLSAMNSSQEATAFAANFKPNAGLQVLKAPRANGGAYYIVVRGPLPSRAAAEALMKSNPAFEKAWLRSAKSMRNQFDKP